MLLCFARLKTSSHNISRLKFYYSFLGKRWLRWYDGAGNWILTPEESQRQQAEQITVERQRADRLLAQLRALGVEPDEQFGTE